MSTTHVTQFIRAPRQQVYSALLDPTAIPQWKVPDCMTCTVHHFSPQQGGTFRISLTYDLPTDTGKTTSQTDTYHGRFAKLVPHECVVEVDEFETIDLSMQGEMTITYSLRDVEGGTELLAIHEGLPNGVRPEDNEYGWKMSLGKLCKLVESGVAVP